MYDHDYNPYTSVTIVKTTKAGETPVSTYEVKVNVYGQGTITITFDQLIEHLSGYGYDDERVIVKVGASADLTQGIIDAYENSTELKYTLITKTMFNKEKSKLQKQLKETIEYDEALAHIANQNIEIDLDDGVKVNYAKFQNILVSKEGKKSKKINLLKKL